MALTDIIDNKVNLIGGGSLRSLIAARAA